VLHPWPDQQLSWRTRAGRGLADPHCIVEQNFVFTHKQQKRGQPRKISEYW
jgi:hypothetical protein